MNKNCLFDYHYNQQRKQQENEIGYIDEEYILKATQENTIHECSMFPSFPDLNLVTNISGQRYERIDCVSNMAFLPEQYKKQVSLEIEYKTPIPLNKNNIRMIRKLLESVDVGHCLVFEKESNCHQAVGTTKVDDIKDRLIPIVKITGHMTWEAYIHDFPMFCYQNGEFNNIEEKTFSKNKFWKLWNSSFENSVKNLCENEKKKYFEGLSRIIDVISKLNHGTSIVILNDKIYSCEVKRLLIDGAGHGILLKEQTNFFELDEDELKKLLSQITKIDGGLLISLDGKADAIGCIFDGKVFPSFKGNSGRGSRYNSIKLYVDDHRCEQNNECLGIIISDDGSIDYISGIN